MAKTSRTKTYKSNTLGKYIKAEVQDYSGGPRNYADSSTKEFNKRDNSDYDESTEERDEGLKRKYNNSGKDSMKTPNTNNGSKYPTPTEYLVKKNPKDIYERKENDSNKEEESMKRKKKHQYNGSSDTDNNDDGGESSSYSSYDSDDGSNQAEARDFTNTNEAWELFLLTYKLKPDNITALKDDLGYEEIGDTELLGASTTVDLTIFTATSITHSTAVRTGIFGKFLYLQGYFKQCNTLHLMALYNNNTKTPDDDDEELDNSFNGKGMLRPVSHSVIDFFDNDTENFETYWATAEGILKQTNLGRHLYKPIVPGARWNLLPPGTLTRHAYTTT